MENSEQQTDAAICPKCGGLMQENPKAFGQYFCEHCIQKNSGNGDQASAEN